MENLLWTLDKPGGSERVTWILVGKVLYERLEHYDPKFGRFVLKNRPVIIAKNVTKEEAEKLVAARRVAWKMKYEDSRQGS